VDLSILVEVRALKYHSAYLVKDQIFGEGIINDKDLWVASLSTEKAIRESGV